MVGATPQGPPVFSGLLLYFEPTKVTYGTLGEPTDQEYSPMDDLPLSQWSMSTEYSVEYHVHTTAQHVRS